MATPSDNRNYYEILHVSRDAPLEIIRGSYRTLMQRLKHHPDLGGDASTAALINEAYAVLSNAERRAEYDARMDLMAHIAEGIPDVSPEPPPSASPRRVLDWSRQCVFCTTPHNHGSQIELETACQSCGSPLAAAERHRMETDGKRAVERVGKRTRVTYYTHWPQQKGHDGRIEDLSLNGMRLVTAQDLVEGQCIKVVSDVVQAVAQVTNIVYERRGWNMRCIAGTSFITLHFGRSVGAFVSNRV